MIKLYLQIYQWSPIVLSQTILAEDMSATQISSSCKHAIHENKQQQIQTTLKYTFALTASDLAAEIYRLSTCLSALHNWS